MENVARMAKRSLPGLRGQKLANVRNAICVYTFNLYSRAFNGSFTYIHTLKATIIGTVAVSPSPKLAVSTSPKPKCPKCGTITGGTYRDGIESTGVSSCCAPGGTWYGKCGKDGEAEYSWTHGLEACECKNRFLRSFESCRLPSLICHRHIYIFLCPKQLKLTPRRLPRMP